MNNNAFCCLFLSPRYMWGKCDLKSVFPFHLSHRISMYVIPKVLYQGRRNGMGTLSVMETVQYTELEGAIYIWCFQSCAVYNPHHRMWCLLLSVKSGKICFNYLNSVPQ